MFSLRRLSALALAALLALSSAPNAAVLAQNAGGLDTGAVLGALISSVGSVMPLAGALGGNNGTASSPSGAEGIVGSLAGVTAGFLSGDSANTGRALGGTGGVSNVLSSVTGGSSGGNGGSSIITTATNLISSFTGGGGRKMLRA